MGEEKSISFHQRVLPIPPALASFSSSEGQKIFQEALLSGFFFSFFFFSFLFLFLFLFFFPLKQPLSPSGGMKQYFGLAEQYRTQDEPAYCGLSSLVMVLNAMKIDTPKVYLFIYFFFFFFFFFFF